MGESYDGPERRKDASKLDRIAEDCAATRAHIQNLKEHIIAVGMNVKDVRESLADHKENCPIISRVDVLSSSLSAHVANTSDAHGRGVFGQVAAWLSLAIAAVVGLFELRRH